LLGCSFTHGWGVNDEETYAWRLQEMLPDYRVVNFGVVGYGTVHSWIQFETAFRGGGKPRGAGIAYARLHAARNTFLRSHRKCLVPFSKLGERRQPYARLDAEGSVRLHEADALYTEFVGMRQSAVVHALERTYNRIEDHFWQSHEVSKALLLKFHHF